MTRIFALSIGLLALLGSAGSAQAALLTGKTLGCNEAPGSNNINCNGVTVGNATAVVGPGVEFTFTIATVDFSVDIDEFGLFVMRKTENTAITLGTTILRLSDVFSAIDPFLDFNLISANNVTGITPFDFSNTANSVDLDFSQTSWASGLFGEIRAQIVGPVQVPEPSSIALLGLALAGLGMAKRRRKA